MHTIELYKNKEQILFAECIEELTPKQASAFFDLVLQFKLGIITPEVFKIKLTIKLLALKYNWKYEAMTDDAKESVNSNLARISELVDSFFEVKEVDGRPCKVLRLSFIKNIFPKLGKYYGPSDALTDITFREYRDAYDHYRTYGKTNNEESLNKLIAVLWRKKRFTHWLLKLLPNYNGIVARKYNPAKINTRAKKIGRLPFSTRFGIKCFIDGCFDFLQSGSPEINGSEINFSKLYSSGDGASDGLGLVGILYTVAETGIFGNAETVDNQNLYDIMAMMYQAVMRNEQIREKHNSLDK